MQWSDIQWGDAPTAAAAVFAAIAAVFAGLTLRSQSKQIGDQQKFIEEQSTNLQLERAELRAQADDRRRQQARNVEMRSLLQAHGGGMYGDLTEDWIVEVINRSSEPIRDVTMQCGEDVEAVRGSMDSDLTAVPLTTIGGGDRARLMTEQYPPGELEPKRPVLLFTDNAGVRWRLDEQGDLSEVRPEPTG